MSIRSEYKSIDNRLTIDNNNLLDGYIRVRFEQSVKWYIKKANIFKRLYYFLSIVGIALPATIPIVNSINDCSTHANSVIITILSVITSISASLLTFFKARDKWIQYRYMAEKLQAELSLYVGQIDSYESDKERNKAFLKKMEQLMSDEHDWWFDTIGESDNDKNRSILL